MNKEILIDALAGIDDGLLDSVITQRETLIKTGGSRTRTAFMRVLPIAAAVAILVTGIIALFSVANRDKSSVPGANDPVIVPPSVDTSGNIEDSSNETDPGNFSPDVSAPEPDKNVPVDGAHSLYVSYSLGSTKPSVQSPLYHTFMSTELMSCIVKSEPYYLTVNAGFLGGDPVAEKAYGIVPVLSVINVDANSVSSKILTSFSIDKLSGSPSLNGEDSYQKIYSTEEAESFKIGADIEFTKNKETGMLYFDPALPHNEELALDFSELPFGTVGLLALKLSFISSEDPKHTGISHYIARIFLYFYVGEDHVGFSIKSTDDAIRNLVDIEYGETANDAEIAAYLKKMLKE